MAKIDAIKYFFTRNHLYKSSSIAKNKNSHEKGNMYSEVEYIKV